MYVPLFGFDGQVAARSAAVHRVKPGSVPAMAGQRQRLYGTDGMANLTRMRLTEFWERMRAHFGEVYAESVAKDYVLSGLGNRTADQALAEGTDAKTVWLAVCEAFKIPERRR